MADVQVIPLQHQAADAVKNAWAYLVPLWPFLAAAAASFAATFLRGFQNLNVSNGNRNIATVTGFFMSVLELSALTLAVKIVSGGAWYGIAIVAAGAGLGWNLSMRCHKWMTRAARKAKKERERQKLIERIDQRIAEDRAARQAAKQHQQTQ